MITNLINKSLVKISVCYTYMPQSVFFHVRTNSTSLLCQLNLYNKICWHWSSTADKSINYRHSPFVLVYAIVADKFLVSSCYFPRFQSINLLFIMYSVYLTIYFAWLIWSRGLKIESTDKREHIIHFYVYLFFRIWI